MRIRDAICGDITLESDGLENFCIRTSTFQRLHRIKQLGNAFHVYPSAMHTRFEHSLGVYHQVKKLISQPGFFPKGYELEPGKKRVIQLAALLHDIVHTPFKHTLESDAAILAEPNLSDEYSYRARQMGLNNQLGADEFELLMKILSTKNAYELDEPWLKQVIEDTLSADLLDYSRRDAYFTTGISRTWDERVYDHIAVAGYTGKPYLVAKITGEDGKVTESAITELVNLLEIRYLLNERVYFYPVKIAADSLLVKSLRLLLSHEGCDIDKFRKLYRDMSDEELVNYLIDSSAPEVSFYAKQLKDRNLPGVAYYFGGVHALTKHEKENIGNSCRGSQCLKKWLDCEGRIAEKAGISPENIIIYCHESAMRRKVPDLLIQDEAPNPYPISEHRRMQDETQHISTKHESLWRCYVFSFKRDVNSLKRIEDAANEVLKNL